MDAGPDVSPYHDRQIIPLTRDLWADWLDHKVPAAEVLKHLPAGSLMPRKVWPPQDDAPDQGSLLLGR
jgi:putative SOS response-associated peptidase YedK